MNLSQLLLAVLAVLQAASTGLGLCPKPCTCQDSYLRASCVNASFDIIPIQLNPSLQHCDLSHNRITSIHFALEIYTALVELNLSHNRLHSLGGRSFNWQHQLDRLNLSHNLLENLGNDAFTGLVSLSTLDLSSNNIRAIGKNTFRNTTRLRTLILRNNDLAAVDVPAALPPALEYLDLSENRLGEVPGAISRLVALRHLELAFAGLAAVPDDTFRAMMDITGLNLEGNQLRAIPTVALSNLGNLTSLNIGGNPDIAGVESLAFRGLFQLRELRLHGLPAVRNVSDSALADNGALRVLDMDNCSALKRLPRGLFANTPQLQVLSLRGTALQTLDRAYLQVPRGVLRHVRLAGAPLVCNCTLLWLRDERPTRANRSDDPVRVDDARCAGPAALAGRPLSTVPADELGCDRVWTAADLWLLTATAVSACALGLFGAFLLTRLASRRNRAVPPTPTPYPITPRVVYV